MIRRFLQQKRVQHWGVFGGVCLIALLGSVNTPEFAKHIIPKIYWNTQIFWTERQLVYAQRDMDYTAWTVESLTSLRGKPLEVHSLELEDSGVDTATRKMLARRQRSIEKENLLKFKVERLKRSAARSMGDPRQPQVVEGL